MQPWFRDIDWDKLERLELQPPFLPQVKSVDDVRNIDDEFLQEVLSPFHSSPLLTTFY